jgi:hypothetical protein
MLNPMLKERLPPNPIAGLVAWCERWKTDALPYVKKLEEASRRIARDKRTEALLFLVCIAFQAGRQWQHDRPDNTALLHRVVRVEVGEGDAT